MPELAVAATVFFCLLASSLGCLLVYERLPAPHRQEDTHAVVRAAAGIFVVMTSLVLGLFINSAKNTFEQIDRNVHAFGTELILLNRAMRLAGPETAAAREQLEAYVQRAIAGTWPGSGPTLLEDRTAEGMLDEVETSLKAIRASDPDRNDLLQDARRRLQKVVELRWSLIEQSAGTIPAPLVVMLVAWLTMIFASFGYRAPRNPTVVTTLVVAAFLISSALYLILDMDEPFAGPIQVSPAPLQSALEHIRR